MNYKNSSFSGTYLVLGGSSTDYPAGAGTVYLMDHRINKSKLLVDNKIVGTTSAASRADMTRMTWIFASSGVNSLSFDELDIRGGGKLAAKTQTANAKLTWNVGTVSGDRSGMLFILKYQEIDMTKGNGKQQELLWGLSVQQYGDLVLPRSLNINRIGIVVAGRISGAENVTIGPEGTFTVKYVFAHVTCFLFASNLLLFTNLVNNLVLYLSILP